ncbi:hypothetical protein ABZ907_15600 [Nonomuraea wenchangensis]
MGPPDEAAKREGLCSKLKRLMERGWAKEEGPGMFTMTDPVAREMADRQRATISARTGNVFKTEHRVTVRVVTGAFTPVSR